jgi:hypothetical protein
MQTMFALYNSSKMPEIGEKLSENLKSFYQGCMISDFEKPLNAPELL